MKKVKFILMCAILSVTTPMAAKAQVSNVFATAIVVNDDIITNYELLQRASMLQLFGATSNLRELAKNQLIDERIYHQVGRDLGINPAEEDVAGGMSEFAARANLTADQLVEILASRGVARESFVDFVRSGLIWRMVVQTKFARQATVTENEINTALRQSRGASGKRSPEILSYAQLVMANAEGEDAKKQAAQARVLRTQIDTCLDLRAAREQFAGSRFSEGGGTSAQVQSNIAALLQNLDTNETTSYTTANGETAVLMLCSRSRELAEIDRSNIQEVLTNQKVVGLANGYLQELKGEAYIATK